MLTDQELFDKVSTHLLTQMEQSQDADEAQCMYRGENGLKCALGCLIDDSWYRPTFEGCTPDESACFDSEQGRWQRQFVNEISQRVSANLALLTELQHVHDQYDPEEWKQELSRVADQFNLKGPA